MVLLFYMFYVQVRHIVCSVYSVDCVCSIQNRNSFELSNTKGTNKAGTLQSHKQPGCRSQ